MAKDEKGRIDQDATLEEVQSETLQRELGAIPVDKNDPTSPWLTVPEMALSGIQKVLGKSDYRARAGVCAWLNGVYWIRILARLPNGELLIENLHDVGKKKMEPVRASIEPNLVYPLLRGRDVKRWQAEPAAYIILAQDPQTRTGVPETEMKRQYPKTYAYFKLFEEQLRQRSGYRRYFKPTDPFWAMYNVGPYTLTPWKVMWPEVGHEVQAGVCNPILEESDCLEKPPIPDHTIITISCERGKSEAYFLAAGLNSSPSRAIGLGYITLHPSPHVLNYIAVPRFDPNNALHIYLTKLSECCHDAKVNGDESTITALESEIDKAAAQLWGITSDELKAIQETVKGMQKSK